MEDDYKFKWDLKKKKVVDRYNGQTYLIGAFCCIKLKWHTEENWNLKKQVWLVNKYECTFSWHLTRTFFLGQLDVRV